MKREGEGRRRRRSRKEEKGRKKIAIKHALCLDAGAQCLALFKGYVQPLEVGRDKLLQFEIKVEVHMCLWHNEEAAHDTVALGKSNGGVGWQSSRSGSCLLVVVIREKWGQRGRIHLKDGQVQLAGLPLERQVELWRIDGRVGVANVLWAKDIAPGSVDERRREMWTRSGHGEGEARAQRYAEEAAREAGTAMGERATV